MKLKIKPSVDRMDEYLEARRVRDEAQRRFALAEQDLMLDMVKATEKSKSKVDGGKQMKVTYVQGTRTTVDAEGLRKAIGAVRYRKLCDLKLSNEKVEKALNDGELEQEVLGPLVVETPVKPYLRFSEGAITDDA